MKLTQEIVNEINLMLKKEKLGFPDYRREIDLSGKNYQWLKKAIGKSDKASDRLKELFK